MILDTNGLSAIADGDMKLAQLLQPATEIAVPVVVLGEFQSASGCRVTACGTNRC